MSELVEAPGRPVRRGWAAARRFVSVVLLGLALGLLGGVLWEFLWTPPTGAVWEGKWIADKDGVTAVVGGTGWFVLVGAGYGLLYGLCVAVLTRGQELVTLVGLLVGALLASRLTLLVGGVLGPDDPNTLAPQMENWEPLLGNLEVSAPSAAWWPAALGSTALLAPAFAALSTAGIVWFLTLGGRRHA